MDEESMNSLSVNLESFNEWSVDWLSKDPSQ